MNPVKKPKKPIATANKQKIIIKNGDSLVATLLLTNSTGPDIVVDFSCGDRYMEMFALIRKIFHIDPRNSQYKAIVKEYLENVTERHTGP